MVAPDMRFLLLMTALAALPAAAATLPPGYVDDRSCKICHRDQYLPYQEVGMARSFYRPDPGKAIEDFDATYFHEPSRRHYEMGFADGRLTFRRYQLDSGDARVNVYEQEVDWILGSGHTSRTYLFQTPNGELYQLPVAWYTQTASWGMAPGFDDAAHLGVTRRARRECLFCHNAYADVSPGDDHHWGPHTYPTDLPEGTGCQRCHGPAGKHVRAATEEMKNVEKVRSSIVNPAKLPPRLRDDVCDQCHLQPSVALAGVRRFGRGDFSYRPGEPLADYLVQVDVDAEGEAREERFEINHHPYRLRQSKCYEASGRELSCLTCHDPHRKVPAAQRAAHYRAACLGCHQVDACRLDEMTAEAEDVDGGDCVACHMSRRRTQDVVHVVMTDHLIRRRPGGPELLAPRQESAPVLVDVEILDRERGSRGALAEVYRAIAVLRASASPSAVDHLAKMLPAAAPPQIDPYLDLAKAQISLHRFADAERTLLGVLARWPGHPLAREWLALARFQLGREDAAVAELRELVREHPGRAEPWFNLGLFLTRAGELEEALDCLRRALAARPNMAPAWYYAGVVSGALGRPDDAAAGYRRALEIDPNHDRARLALGEAAPETSTRSTLGITP
jgi:Flp pilus assembly protein TadD